MLNQQFLAGMCLHAKQLSNYVLLIHAPLHLNLHFFAALVTIDTLRAQVSCALCMLNLALVFFSRALAAALCKEDKMSKNLEAMKRQTQGLQAEYARLTNAGDKGGAAGSDEVQALKAQVDKLIAQKEALQAESEKARKSQAQAEATAEALKRQAGGLNTEYDRVVEENLVLNKKLAQAGVPGYLPQADRLGKKDS
ncbi:hypothetical protein DUNSADRAFT_3638 [Dunaliella salina]|uniref:Endoplasmic reticulum transmembrane protein n=1 Tax=Dunaliella salina TaxID=3046 RepID=A0ABQ7GTP3_DUNSA|nr:hypothetical protein DUNSADRAFT_3638 [Dunaliella salina]|eukprot:KAF5837977.1 hypothetical protein DUNSADRAFT_3638 [Dunaliella salina]